MQMQMQKKGRDEKKCAEPVGTMQSFLGFRLVREQGCPISHALALHLDYYCTSAERILESESMYYKGHIPGLHMYKYTKKNTFSNVTWNVPPQEWGRASKFNMDGCGTRSNTAAQGQHLVCRYLLVGVTTYLHTLHGVVSFFTSRKSKCVSQHSSSKRANLMGENNKWRIVGLRIKKKNATIR